MATYHSAGNQESVQQKPGAEPHDDVMSLTPLQSHYLSVLEQRLALKTTYDADPRKDPWLLKTIDKAAYSAFRSCIEHGVEAQATVLLENRHMVN